MPIYILKKSDSKLVKRLGKGEFISTKDLLNSALDRLSHTSSKYIDQTTSD